MTIRELADAMGWRLLAGEEGQDRQVAGCYIGDLLSWVMSRARADNVWLTVMGNVNTIGVAALTDVAGIVLCEEAALDEVARQRAETQGIPVFGCSQPIYEAAIRVHEALQ